jgi:Flp pilus assembly protein TadG
MTMSLQSPRRILPTVRRAIGLRRWLRDRDGDRGASAVEFALVSPLLFTLLFGAIDYGLYFSDALTLQQSVADAAREATLSVGSVSANWPGSGSCPIVTSALNVSATNDLAKVICSLSASTQPIGGGVVAVKAEIVDAGGQPTAEWKPKNRLRVCALTRHSAVLPFVPMPDGGLIASKTEMPIQPGSPTNPILLFNAVAQDAGIVGGDWKWC